MGEVMSSFGRALFSDETSDQPCHPMASRRILSRGFAAAYRGQDEKRFGHHWSLERRGNDHRPC